MPLKGLEEFREREKEKRYRRVKATVPGLLDAEFHIGKPVRFVYHGEERSGVVKRLPPGYISIWDDDRQGIRTFKESEVEGRAAISTPENPVTWRQADGEY